MFEETKFLTSRASSENETFVHLSTSAGNKQELAPGYAVLTKVRRFRRQNVQPQPQRLVEGEGCEPPLL